ncbi:MAG: GTPase ObgE [SAR202 cluster bacterium]|jgi:GTP-binding protein|nr:MAG: GTPase ObgE [SAR202 cluster bacterium]KAA1305266.1 MAG: GTPase ObgE [SAR202 cluster bacterium]MEC7836951.1 GTPase ObgE [Chloroflexota bacterium]MED5409686.1 GTPase ObgE [Chloroflexota bacterium]MED5449494.1 GTPase ObgE [Chloroflexota bacterium]
MIDSVLIQITSGSGGDGAISGRHEKFVPRGGPDGGDGGRGGNVIIVGDHNENTLINFRYEKNFSASNGENGSKAKKHGKDGDDVVIRVPVGTQIINETGSVVADILNSGEEYMAAPGGRGGYGNVKYSSSTSQYPVIAQAGEEGLKTSLRLELKLIADVGIIGVPNAGKSSLITFLTAARPKIANYPFTTIDPVLGIVEHRDKDFVMVDIPGLIEGAHEGIGLGHEFLRHIERTRVLIHLVDGTSENPSEDFHKINKELALFNEALIGKPQILAINKVDLDEVSVLAEDIRDSMGEDAWKFHIISAVSGEGVGSMMDEVVQVLSDQPSVIPPNLSVDLQETDIPVIRPEPRRRGVSIYQEDGVYVVQAPGVERIAQRIDYEDWLARMQFYKHMQKTGVVKALEDAGISEGDTVRIGDIEWEWD